MTAKTLRKHFPTLTAKQAAFILAPLEERDRHVDGVDGVLDRFSDTMGFFGVESIQGNNWVPYYLDIALLYVNTGDSYGLTLCYDVDKGRFFAGSWGGFVERMGL